MSHVSSCAIIHHGEEAKRRLPSVEGLYHRLVGNYQRVYGEPPDFSRMRRGLYTGRRQEKLEGIDRAMREIYTLTFAVRLAELRKQVPEAGAEIRKMVFT